jgi:hypothetical protein
MAHKIPIGFAEETDKEGDTRDQSNTNGCPAMDELLKCMKDENPDDKPTKYGSFVLWSDGFLRSYVKQKENMRSPVKNVTFFHNGDKRICAKDSAGSA